MSSEDEEGNNAATEVDVELYVLSRAKFDSITAAHHMLLSIFSNVNAVRLMIQRCSLHNRLEFSEQFWLLLFQIPRHRLVR